MKIKKTFLLSAFILVLPFYSMAWGLLGHRVIGGIAERYLSPKAKKAVKGLLGNESLAIASNWADFIKSDNSYHYLGPWHYINLPGNMSAAQFSEYLKKDIRTDLYTRIKYIIGKLKSKKLSRDKEVFYLKLLIHFVGDVHQPMHTGRLNDKGGNDIKLYWFNKPTNLHRVWDEQLIAYQQLSYTEYITAINYASRMQIQQWQRQPVSQWIYESYRIAEQLYKEVQLGDRLWYNYNFSHVKIMNDQLLKGGIRLAAVLNDIFDPR